MTLHTRTRGRGLKTRPRCFMEFGGVFNTARISAISWTHFALGFSFLGSIQGDVPELDATDGPRANGV